MKIKLTGHHARLLDGKHVEPGESVDVTPSLGRYLVGNGLAAWDEAPPAEPPGMVGTDWPVVNADPQPRKRRTP